MGRTSLSNKGAKVCPRCLMRGAVINSRHTGRATRRRYRCDTCGHRWSTVEMFMGDDGKRRTTHTLVEKFVKGRIKRLVEGL